MTPSTPRPTARTAPATRTTRTTGTTPAEAREAAGLTLEQAARLARITPAYLRRKEREGGFSVVVASRLERAYRCDIKVFLARNVSTREETNGRKKATKRTTTVTASRDTAQGRHTIAFPAPRAVDSGGGNRAQ